MSASTPTHAVSALILAAGASTRLGQPKQAVSFAGSNLLRRAVNLAVSCVNRDVNVVVGANAAQDRDLISGSSTHIHEYQSWALGQSASLHYGLSQIRTNDALLVMVVDQYRLTEEDMRRLIDAWRVRPDVPAAAFYADRPGVPVVWPPLFVEQLLASGGPGRELLRGADCQLVAMSGAEFDLDTEEDLAALRRYERALYG